MNKSTYLLFLYQSIKHEVPIKKAREVKESCLMNKVKSKESELWLIGPETYNPLRRNSKVKLLMEAAINSNKLTPFDFTKEKQKVLFFFHSIKLRLLFDWME